MVQSLTKAEVADLTGRSTRWVELNAERLGARRAGRKITGFDLSALPAEVQRRWAERRRVVELVPAGPPAPGQLALSLTAPVGPNLSDEDRAEAERRYQVIEPLIAPDKYHLIRLQCPTQGQLIAYLAEQHQVKPRTIYHWLKAWKECGLPALVTRDRSDKGKPRALNTAALDFLVAAALPRQGAYGELSVREIFRAYLEEREWRARHAGRDLGEFERRKYQRYLDGSGRLAAAAQLPEASYETFRTWFGRIPEVVRVLARDGEEAFSNTQEVISFRAISEVKPLDYVVMDHRRLDLFAMVQARGEWKLVRPWLTAAIDMRTRKWLAWAIVETPSSDSIASVLKRTFLDFGLPGSVYWDNGKDFTCEWFEGRATKSRTAERVGELGPAWRGVLETLGVRVHHAIVRRARSKIIEPNFLNTSLFDKTLPWWCGHKPSARPERFDELVKAHEAWVAGERTEPVFPTIEQVASLYADALEALNERDHTGEGMQKLTPTGKGWMCPNECWEREIGRVQRRSVPADVLQFAFAKRKELQVRNGEIRCTFAGRQYHYRLSGNGVGLMALNGQVVQFAYDPLDLGEAAVYYQDRFQGLVQCVELRRMGEEAFVQDERDRRAARREVRKFIGAVHSQVHVPGPVERAARRADVQPVRMEPERAIAAAPVATEVVAAAETAERERAFRFAEVAAVQAVADGQAETPADDEFVFFGGPHGRSNQ